MEFIAFLHSVDMLVSVLLYVQDRNQTDESCSFSSPSNFLLCSSFDLSCKFTVYLCLRCLNKCHHMKMFLAGLFNFVRVLAREIWVWVTSVLPERLCTNSLSLIMSAHPILQVLDKEIRKARGGVHRKQRERDKGLKATSWVDVRQLTVNTLGSDYKTRANDSPMISLPNNVLHVSPSATFFPFSSIFL